jgi:RimJ/RimL family protein N-acetyltransferase
VFRAFFDDAMAKGGALAIIDKARGAIIGSSRLQDHDPVGTDGLGVVEIGWSFLARSHWGRGYNAEFKRLMLRHAFTHVDRVLFRVGAENLISRRAMEKIGGGVTGETFTAERAGRSVEHVVYAITRESFAAGPLAR